MLAGSHQWGVEAGQTVVVVVVVVVGWLVGAAGAVCAGRSLCRQLGGCVARRDGMGWDGMGWVEGGGWRWRWEQRGSWWRCRVVSGEW